MIKASDHSRVLKELSDLKTQTAALRAALTKMLTIWDSPELAAEVAMAVVHGSTCDPAISKRNQAWIAAARALLADAGPQPSQATYASERAAVIAEVGDCCGGGDPMCTGGCLVQKALLKRGVVDAGPTADE